MESALVCSKSPYLNQVVSWWRVGFCLWTREGKEQTVPEGLEVTCMKSLFQHSQCRNELIPPKVKVFAKIVSYMYFYRLMSGEELTLSGHPLSVVRLAVCPKALVPMGILQPHQAAELVSSAACLVLFSFIGVSCPRMRRRRRGNRVLPQQWQPDAFGECSGKAGCTSITSAVTKQIVPSPCSLPVRQAVVSQSKILWCPWTDAETYLIAGPERGQRHVFNYESLSKCCKLVFEY